MRRRFVQYNRYRGSDAAFGLDKLRTIVAVARRLSDAETALEPIAWALWRSLNAVDGFYALITEEYVSAGHWGRAEEIGIDHAELRAILTDTRALGLSPHQVVLLAEHSDVRAPAKSRGLGIASFAAGTSLQDMERWAEEARALEPKPHTCARFFAARVSGDLFDVRQVWLYFETADQLSDLSSAGIAYERFELLA